MLKIFSLPIKTSNRLGLDLYEVHDANSNWSKAPAWPSPTAELLRCNSVAIIIWNYYFDE